MPDQTTATRVVVVGACNLDVVARPRIRPTEATSNPGTVRMRPGGVGRNIAENLARLGTSVALVSTIGTDPAGAQVLDATRAAGVDVEHVRRTMTATGSYVALLDETGELATAVSDMAATDELGEADVAAAAHLVAAADMVVLDGNLPVPVLRAAWALAAEHDVAVVLDPVSVPKANRLAPCLDGSLPLAVLSAGRAELDAVLRATGLTDPADLLERDVDVVWERCGAEGSRLHLDEGVVALSAPEVPPDAVADVNGAGDAMLAAFCHRLLRGDDEVAAARYGHVAAALTVSSALTVRPDLSQALSREGSP
ncbi:MAG: carbohydrate kinase [Nocardioides sp.]|nr:carbohydrate kinase [Nocardioides sp.]